MAEHDDTPVEKIRKKAKQRTTQATTIEEMYAEHLLTEHGAVAMGDTPSKFHERYYRQCPFIPAAIPSPLP